jgi:hypothetical protein
MVKVEISFLTKIITDEITRRRLMSNLTPEKLSANLPETSEKPQWQHLEAMFARLDEEWQELKEFLKVGVQPDPRELSASQVYLNRLRQAVQEDSDTSETAASPFPPPERVRFEVTPLEAEAIIERVEKFGEETTILERVGRLERQCRRFTIRCSLFCILMCALMVVFMVISTHNLRENLVLGGTSLVQIARGIILPQPTVKKAPSMESTNRLRIPATGEPQTSPPDQKRADPASAKEHSLLTGPSREPTASAPAQEISALPANQEYLSITNIFKEPAIPEVKYVGSITSNKYHYPDCKWAKTIIPKKLRGFLSVAEAKKAGYIRCPVCQPPLTDNPE